MNKDAGQTSIANKLTDEDVVIVISIVMSLILAPLLTGLWFLETPILIPPPIISVFLGIAVSALLYRFLGGVHDASFTVGALKVTGTAAILIFVSWWVNGELKPYIPSIDAPQQTFNISEHSIPDYTTWFAVNKENGHPISLQFPTFNQTHSPPSIEELNVLRKERNIHLSIENGQIFAGIHNGSTQVLGQISSNEINNLGFERFNGIKMQLIPYRVVEFSSSQKVDINAKLPFKIETTGFSENYTRFAIISKIGDVETIEESILLRGAKVIDYRGKHYLISVVQVNHNPEDREPYAKIYVAEIQASNV